MTVSLTCATPLLLGAPSSSSNGSYQIYWTPTDVSGALYELQESVNGGAFV